MMFNGCGHDTVRMLTEAIVLVKEGCTNGDDLNSNKTAGRYMKRMRHLIKK